MRAAAPSRDPPTDASPTWADSPPEDQGFSLTASQRVPAEERAHPRRPPRRLSRLVVPPEGADLPRLLRRRGGLLRSPVLGHGAIVGPFGHVLQRDRHVGCELLKDRPDLVMIDHCIPREPLGSRRRRIEVQVSSIRQPADQPERRLQRRPCRLARHRRVCGDEGGSRE